MQIFSFGTLGDLTKKYPLVNSKFWKCSENNVLWKQMWDRRLRKYFPQVSEIQSKVDFCKYYQKLIRFEKMKNTKCCPTNHKRIFDAVKQFLSSSDNKCVTRNVLILILDVVLNVDLTFQIHRGFV